MRVDTKAILLMSTNPQLETEGLLTQLTLKKTGFFHLLQTIHLAIFKTWIDHDYCQGLSPRYNRDGLAMTRCNVTQRLNIAVTSAAQTHISLTKRSISPHTIRHTTAMHLLQPGVAFSVIALWLGHESTMTTHRYVEADLAMKEKA
jgi:integrase